jgi:hypothetical protein
MDEATVYSEMRKKHARKRKRQSNSDSHEQNKPRKKRPKVEYSGTGSDPLVSHPETEMSGMLDSNSGISPVIKKVRIKAAKKVKLQNQDRLQTYVTASGDQKLLDETRRCSGKYYIMLLHVYCLR